MRRRPLSKHGRSDAESAALCVLDSDLVGNGHNDMPRGPDLTPDTALDDFEERDLIFTRISDLVTVRSDVFTAYRPGPDRRAGPAEDATIAIFDRSRVDSAGDKVRTPRPHPCPTRDSTPPRAVRHRRTSTIPHSLLRTTEGLPYNRARQYDSVGWLSACPGAAFAGAPQPPAGRQRRRFEGSCRRKHRHERRYTPLPR